MLKGMTHKGAAPVDSSMKLGKESVASEATRKETAPAEKTIGPRTA